MESKSIDVTPQVQEDVALHVERNDRSQFRLQIDTPTNGNGVNDRTIFSRASFLMTLVYTAN